MFLLLDLPHGVRMHGRWINNLSLLIAPTMPCRRRRRHRSTMYSLLLLFLTLSLVAICCHAEKQQEEQQQQECSVEENDDQVCHGGSSSSSASSSSNDDDHGHLECGMYMAESSIPNSGWGMYTAIERKKGDPIHPLDLVVQVTDLHKNIKLRSETLPKWLLSQYYWAPETTGAYYDAKAVQSIVPGLGMLANSHTGLVNLEFMGPTKHVVARNTVEAGAYTEYTNQTFHATDDIPPGHELMVEYGDEWFQDRAWAFGDAIPLSNDYVKANKLLTNLRHVCQDDFTSIMCTDLWKWVRNVAFQTFPDNKRLFAALPDESMSNVQHAYEVGTARHLTPHVVRSVDWLQQHGLCLDHLTPKESTIKHAGMGAFATRPLSKDTVVAPAPVVHLHRGHMELFFIDPYDSTQVHWKGHQLLYNYLYGHPSTSLVFFPYSPIVNFINHDSNQKPNVALRWSSHSQHFEWMNWTVNQVVEENSHSGLMMELVALRDIREGEEVLLDYGSDWQDAWTKHQETWQPPLDSDFHVAIQDMRVKQELPTEQNGEELPQNFMTLCYVDDDHVVDQTDENGDDYSVWLPSTPNGWITNAHPCNLVSSRRNEEDIVVYTARVKMGKRHYLIKDIDRRAIEIVDKPYTSNQLLRQSFRHFIQLPDDMIPDAWKDREVINDSCGLYMAESTIPNSGLGMFTGTHVKEKHDISYPDIVIQTEDPEENHQLRRWAHGIMDDSIEPLWLLEQYFWNSDFAAGTNEAATVQSIVPAIGMLANSVTGRTNAISRRPHRDNAGLLPKKDPGAGASTSYHGHRFVAHHGDIEAGAEIFVEYGDTWFWDHRGTLGAIPLSTHYTKADKLLESFWDQIGGDANSTMSRDAWDLFRKVACLTTRMCMALPEDLNDVQGVLDTGTAEYSVRNAKRSIEWLEKHGRCLDNMKPGISKIPQAGHGAFATRPIAQGDIVAPAPVVQLRRRQMEVWESADTSLGPDAEIYEIGSQLLLNYCFGHENSSVLLYPYTPVVNYINHDHTNYNTELRWSTFPNHNKEMMNRTIDELMAMDHTGLIMEYVATRDIAPGEEILIDYGEQWEKAWQEHVESWEPDPEYENYIPSWTFNDYTRPIRNEDERMTEPYPPQMIIECYTRHINDATTRGSIVDGQVTYEWHPTDDLYFTTLQTEECSILNRYDGYVSTADSIRPVNEKYNVKVWRHSNEIPTIITGVPRRAIELFDHVYASELAMRSAFRHEMHLPDSMLPPAWKNLEEVEEEEGE